MASKQAEIEYSEKYQDSRYEYRHVILPKEVAKKLPNPPRILSEAEWRGLGVCQSLGWVHYEIHRPEPHVLLFRRPLQSLPCDGLFGSHRPLPCGSPGDGLGTLPTIAHRCSPCDAWRSGCLGIDRILPGLIVGSVLPGRDGPSRSSATSSPTDPHRCGDGHRPSLRLHSGALACRPARLTPGSSPGVGPGIRLTPPPLPSAPPSTSPEGPPLSRSPCASTPGREASFPSFGLGMPIPRSCSVLVVSHHLDGLLRATARGLVASLCRPWGSSRFVRDSPKTCAFPVTLPPLEELPRPAVGSPVTRCLGPPAVPPRVS